MSSRNKSDLLDFVYKKVVEEEAWDLKIIEQRRRGKMQKQVALNRSNKAFYDETEEENEARIQFTEVFGDFLIEIDDIDEEYETKSVEWYWKLGEKIEHSDVIDQVFGKNHESLGALIPSDEIDGEVLRGARKIHNMFPEKEYPETDRTTMLRKLPSNAGSLEEARNVIKRADEHGFVPMNREVRVWKDVSDNPDLDTVAEQINRRMSTYKRPDKKIKSVKRVYQMSAIPDEEVPSEKEILESLQQQESA